MGILVSIIIPCKNEEAYIGKLLDSLVLQNLTNIYEIIIADAGSTDSTLSIIDNYKDKLHNLKVIGGSIPSIGRNLGAKAAKGDILLFIDSDVYFKDNNIINHSFRRFRKNKSELLGCMLNIEHDFFVRLIYFLCNGVIRLSKLDKPFVVGSYFMINKDKFFKLGGFDEELMHCEDYFLSKEINPKKFSVVNKYVYTDNRRFKKMGYLKMVTYFIKNIFKKNDKDYFKKDIGYWL